MCTMYVYYVKSLIGMDFGYNLKTRWLHLLAVVQVEGGVLDVLFFNC